MTARGVRPRARRTLLGAALGIAALLAASCGGGGANDAKTSTPSVTYVAVADRTISMGIVAGLPSCNPNSRVGNTPISQLVLSGVLPSPFTINASGASVANPNLINQSELVNTKPQTVIYTLNPHAVWADGVPITADDFEYAWLQQRAEPTDGSNDVASIEGYKDISSVVGSNHGQTVTVQFKTPFADWQMLFANLLPAHVMERVGWSPDCLSIDPSIDVSGGPFAISSVSAQKIVLTDNPRWWGVQANAKSIVIHFARSTSQLAQWIRTGYVQLALPDSISPSFLTQMDSLPGAQTAVAPSSTLLQLEMDSGPNSNLSPDMRFAIALSIDRQDLVNTVAAWALPSTQVASSHMFIQGQTQYKSTTTTTPSTGAPTTSSSTSTTLIGSGGSVNFPTEPVPAQAAALMTASGFERTNGSPWHTDFGAPFTLHFAIDAADPWAAATGNLIAAQLEQAGFDVSVFKADSAEQAGTALADGLAGIALVPRVDSPFTSQSLAWYSLALGPVGENGSQDWSSFDNAPFTALLENASQQLNPNAAALIYGQADTTLWDEMVALPLFVEPATMVWSRILGGVVQMPKSNSLLWYAQFWAVRVAESTSNTTPPLPGQ